MPPPLSHLSARQPPKRIFLSSTALDLKQHRKRVEQAIMRIGQTTTQMEYFGARPGAPLDECRKLAADKDAVVVMVAHRYGWVPTQEEAGDGKKSITWHEVDAALGAEKPVFAFLVDEQYTWEYGEEQDRLKTAKFAEEATAIYQSVQSLQEFKRFLSDGRVRETFTTPADLAEKVVTSLSTWLWESRASEFESPASQDSALDMWREKLEFLRTQDAIISDPAQRFTVQKQIEEAETKIHELGGQSRAPQRTTGSWSPAAFKAISARECR